MPKHRNSRRHSRHNRSNKIKRGGSNYSSATTYGEYVNGSGNSQYARTLDQGGPYADRAGNILIGAQGQWAKEPNAPTQQNLALVQSAGKSRKKRGGFFGQIIKQAIVPFGLLGLRQFYSPKRKISKTRRHRRH